MNSHDSIEALRLAELGSIGKDGSAKGAPFRRATDDRPKLVDVERFGQIVVGAELHGLYRGTYFSNSRHENDLNRVVHGPDFFEEFGAAGIGQADIEDDHVHGVAPESYQGPCRISGLKDLTAPPENPVHGLADAILIVDHEHDWR